MNDHQRALLANLKAMVDLRSKESSISMKSGGYAYHCVEDFVIRHGKWCHSDWMPQQWADECLPDEMKACFDNARQVAEMYEDLTYVEGYAWSGIMPIHHAWLVDEDGDVIDPTWAALDHHNPLECAYFGVSFTTSQINEMWNGCILDDWTRRWPILKEEWNG